MEEFNKYEINAIESFISLAFYNGDEDDITDIKNALKDLKGENDKYSYAKRPNWKLKCGKNKVDEFGGIFWAWLVLQYGEYGTSPRFGWIYKENAEKILLIIDQIEKGMFT